jgi:hypothetical protein
MTLKPCSFRPLAIVDMDEAGTRRLVVGDVKDFNLSLITRGDIVKQLHSRHLEHLPEQERQRGQELKRMYAELRKAGALTEGDGV